LIPAMLFRMAKVCFDSFIVLVPSTVVIVVVL
jgi:hypothetical protein